MSTSFSFSQKYYVLLKACPWKAVYNKPGIKSVISNSNVLSSTEEKSACQAPNMAEDPGWMGPDFLLPLG